MKAYYAKQDAEKLSGKGDTSQKLTLMKTSADSLKKSADALNDAYLWEKKKIKKKDLRLATGMSTTALAKLGKNQHVSTEILTKICKALDCDFCDIIELVQEDDKH